MKPYLVYDYLMRKTDANHCATAKDIAAYLQECGIDAERRSIYKDIEEINKAILLTTRDRYNVFRKYANDVFGAGNNSHGKSNLRLLLMTCCCSGCDRRGEQVTYFSFKKEKVSKRKLCN